jgi:hypothetical protein
MAHGCKQIAADDLPARYRLAAIGHPLFCIW